MAELTDKLKAFLGMFPDVKAKADTVEAQLEALGVASKEVGRYLVSGEEGDHLPVRDEGGKPDHTLMGAAWAALHGGYRGNKYEGPQKSEALSKLVALYKSEGMDTPSDSTAEKKEMNDTPTDKEITPEMKKKMEDEQAEKEKGKDSPKEEAAEKKEIDPSLIAQLQSSLEATAKESKDLRELLQVTAKETAEIKTTLTTGFEAVAKGLEQRDATIKILEAKVKELAGEVPNAARYVPSESMQNLFTRIASGDLSTLQPIIKESTPTPQAQVAQHPIFSFLEEANQHTGLAPVTNQALPQ